MCPKRRLPKSANAGGHIGHNHLSSGRALWLCSTNADIRTANSESDLTICYSYNYDDNNYNSIFIMFVAIIIIIVMIIITIIVIVSLSSFVQDIPLFYDIAVSR